jgi:hypothetical protein
MSDHFLDSTLLADRQTTLREYLDANPELKSYVESGDDEEFFDEFEIQDDQDAFIGMDDLETMPELVLQSLCQQYDLDFSGEKQELVDRLIAFYESSAEEVVPSETESEKADTESEKVDIIGSDDWLELKQMTVPGLKELGRENHLKVSGKKQELLNRLIEFSGSSAEKLLPSETETDRADVIGSDDWLGLNTMTVPGLKHIGREKLVKVSGQKQELVDRLTAALESKAKKRLAPEAEDDEHDVIGLDDLQEMTVPALKRLCRDKNLKVSGKKQDLIDRLTDVHKPRTKEKLLSEAEDHRDDIIIRDDLKGTPVLDLKALRRDKDLEVTEEEQEVVEVF